MSAIKNLLAIILGLSITLGLVPYSPIQALTAKAATKVTAFWTQEELDIWRQRAKNGPYKSKGDVSPGSPGDWDRIQSKANKFKSNPSAQRWTGQTRTDSCIAKGDSDPGANRHTDLRDSAFVYLLTGDITYRDPVRDELLWHSDGTPPGANRKLDFSNTSVFCTEHGGSDTHPWMDYGNWLTTLAFAYDMIRSDLTASQKTQIDTWLTDGATWLAKLTNHRYENILGLFVDRQNENWTLTSAGLNKHATDPGDEPLFFNGYVRSVLVDAWHNRALSLILPAGVVGSILNDATLKKWAKLFVKEAIQFGLYPDGTWNELHRWTDSLPQLGITYAMGNAARMTMLAEIMARTGDTDLINYSTTHGANNGTLTPTTDGVTRKSLLSMALHMTRYVDNTIERYATDKSARNGNPDYRIKVNRLDGLQVVTDTVFAQANVFWRNDTIKSRYTRQAAGAPAYGSQAGSDAFDKTLPGQLFMFGQMEGKVWPYSGTPPSGVTTGPAACYAFDSASAVPDGYGASYNLFSSQKELLFKTTCDTSSVTADLGNGDQLMYIYNKGYIFRNNQWQQITYNCSNLLANAWCVGNASGKVSLTSTELANYNFIVGYICQWNGSKWNCGCRDQTCAQSFWNLQAFKR